MTDIKGCNAVVKGGGSGIGKALAKALAAQGARAVHDEVISMTPRNKVACFYAATLSMACAAIAGVLHVGTTTLQPSITTKASDSVPMASDLASPAATAWQAFLENLRVNLDHPLSHLFVQLLSIIVLARLMGRLCERIGQPAVIGEIIAGIALGPSLLGSLMPGAFSFIFPASSLGSLRLLSEVGICFFMFAVGMELDIGKLRGRSHVALAVSHISIAFPYVLGVFLAYFLYPGLAGATTFTAFALFIGISMSITAFPVLARILQERGLSRTALGMTAMTCAAIDDVTAWTILAFVVAIAKAANLASLLMNGLLIPAFILLMVFGVRRALPDLIGRQKLAQDDPPLSALAVVTCVVVLASLATEIIGIHALFGAFLAGVAMPEVESFRRWLGERIHSFSSVLLLPLFFAFTGLRTQIGSLHGVEEWSIVLLIVAVATLGKIGGSAAAARFTGMAWHESLALGSLMNTRGLMELIALNIGYDLGILSPRIFTMLVIMAVLTTMMTGPLLTFLLKNDRRNARDFAEPSLV